jgi:hypothetical protein
VNYSCDGDGDGIYHVCLGRVMRNVRLIWLSATVTLFFLVTLLFQLFRFVRIFSLFSAAKNAFFYGT